MSTKDINDSEILAVKNGLLQLGEAIDTIANRELPTPVFNKNSLSGDVVHGGKISDFSSLGIRDEATKQVLVVQNDGIVADYITVATIRGDTTIENDLNVGGTIKATKIEVDEISADVRNARTTPLIFECSVEDAPYGKGLFWTGYDHTKQLVMQSNPDRIWSTEDFDLTGDDHTIDIDQLGNTNTISGSVDGDSQTLTISQDGDSNTSTVNVGTNASADDNSIIQDIEGNSNTTTVNVGTSAASGDADIDLTVEGDSNTVTINENSTAAMIGEDKKITNITLSGGSSDSNTVTSTHAGAGDHDTTLSHTGSDGTFSINQSGAHDTVVDLTTSGADASVTITVTD